MDDRSVLNLLNERYPVSFDRLQFVRDSGSRTYLAFAGSCKYFLRLTKPVFLDTVVHSVDVHAFLQEQGFPVPPILFTADQKPFVRMSGEEGGRFLILYEYIEGDEADPEQDAEEAGKLVGRLHRMMKAYPGSLPKRDKQFYIGRYLDILQKKRYPKADAFAALGEALWERIQDLPRGYCHGDMYRGNILKTADGRFYLLDFDTSCEGFSMYDPVLFCNITDYFQFQEDGYEKSKRVFERFLPEYGKFASVAQREIDAFYDLVAVYHFALQATIIGLFGLDCVDNAFLDNQLDWLQRWEKQCGKEKLKGKGVG